MCDVPKPKDRIDVTGRTQPLTQGLSGLAALRDRLPAAAPKANTSEPPTTTPATNPIATAKKLVVRKERKGHGGKTATRIEGLNGNESELDQVLREIKRTLGCGATIEGNDILVQGDQTERVTAHLQSRGARKVVLGT
jgi:translation initiation factor 1